MPVEIETKPILDNLFCLDPNNSFFDFLIKNSKLGVSIAAYCILGKELRLSSKDLVHIMSDNEETPMEQLDAYDNEIGMHEEFYFLSCT